MAILMNARFTVSMINAYGVDLFPQGYIYLCIGTMPTDAQVDAYTGAADTAITNAIAASFDCDQATGLMANRNGTLLYYDTAKAQVAGLTYVKASATKTGTVGYGIVRGYNANVFAIVDVGLPNTNSTLWVDTLTLTTGSPVYLMGLNYRIWR